MDTMDWYDRAELYHRAFQWDCTAEVEFVLGAARRWGGREPGRILEPMCGPGRVLRHMSAGAVGFDLNPHMVRIAARDCTVFRADAAEFSVTPVFDAAYCLIDSFRHIMTDAAARSHLACVARALKPGGVYCLGLDVNGDIPADVWGCSWEVNGLKVAVKGLGDIDSGSRTETTQTIVEGDGKRIEGYLTMRTYTRRQVEDLIDEEGSFELEWVTDLRYDLKDGLELSEVEGSAVLVLVKG